MCNPCEPVRRALPVVLTILGLAAAAPAPAAPRVVFSTDFEAGVPTELSGDTTIEDVQGYAGVGTGARVFAGEFLRNQTGPGNGDPEPRPTTLTLTGLPPHTTVSLGFLLAVIDSWDGDGCFAGPDDLTVSVDGAPVFSQTFETARAAFRRTRRRRAWSSRAGCSSASRSTTSTTVTRPTTWASTRPSSGSRTRRTR